jgi:putative nucleotidyltransferase with HDIG domain
LNRLSSALYRWLAPLGADLPSLYLVGGAVRDHLLGIESKDIDLMCADPQALAYKLESAHDIALVPFLNKPDTPCLRVVNRADPDDFLDLVPIHGSGVEDDLSRRDFTINAMAIIVGAGGAIGELIDPLGGRQDLRHRVIRAVGPDALLNDPLRVIRAVRFSAELGFEIDAATRRLMQNAAARLAAVASERIVRELFLTLKQPASAPLIRMLDDTGALQIILPEITPLKDCSQNEHHHLNVWDHSLEALEKIEGLLASLTAQFGPAASRLSANLAQDNRLPVLKLAMLLHDAGKPESRSVAPETGRVTFYGHDAAGAAIAERIAFRLKFSVRDRDLLARLIGDHMHMIALSGPDVRSRTILRWFRRLGEDMIPLTLLGMADVLATRGPASSEIERERHLRWGRETIRLYYAEIKDRLERKPLIGGRDLMAIGVPPGPGMGEILDAVRAAQDEGAVQDRAEALALATELTRKDG